MNIYILDISKVTVDIFDSLIDKVSLSRKEKIFQYKNFSQKVSSLFGELLYRKQLSEILKTRPDEIKFNYNIYGKPYLSEKKDLFFNISHKGSYVILCISSNDVGIDIEFIRPIDISIAFRYFTKAEAHYITSTPSYYYQRFFEVWTRKESFIKTVGKGLSMSLHTFSVVQLLNENYMLIDKINFQSSQYYFTNYEYRSNYLIAVCSKEKQFSASIVEVSFREFLIRY